MGKPIDWSGVDFTLPDEENARRLRCSPGAVKKARLRRGKLRPTNWRSKSRTGVDWSAQPLGKEPDHVIARRVGVHRQTVERARGRAGIRPCIAVMVPVELPVDILKAIKKRHPNVPARDAVLAEIRAAMARRSK